MLRKVLAVWLVMSGMLGITAIVLPAPVASADTIVTLSGVLTDSSGNPVAGANVSASSNTTSDTASTTSGADGSYSLELLPDSYAFEADATVDGTGQSVTINDLSISSSLVENFSFRAVGTVTTNVVDSNGNPVPSASVFTVKGSSQIDANTQDGTPYKVSGGGYSRAVHHR